jgi:hypothetical protein
VALRMKSHPLQQPTRNTQLTSLCPGPAVQGRDRLSMGFQDCVYSEARSCSELQGLGLCPNA